MIGLWLPKGNLINVGDVYEDCAYAVAVCTEVTSYRWTSGWRRWTPFTSDQDVIGVTEEGKGSSCSARHCRPVVITRAKHASVRWHHGTPLIGQRGDDSQRGDDLEEAVRRHGRDDSQGSCGPVPGRDGSQSISGWLAGEAEERADAEERGEVDPMPGQWPDPVGCAHCGWPRQGFARLATGEAVCHTSDQLPDCYRRVTVYNEPLGALANLVADRDQLPVQVEQIQARS